MDTTSSPRTNALNKSKLLKSKGICCFDDNSVPLYVGATALFVSVVSVLFFYRELKKLKETTGDIKQLRNQVSNIDKRFDLIDRSIEDLITVINSEKKSQDTSQATSQDTSSKEPKKEVFENSPPKVVEAEESEDESEDESEEDSEEELEEEPKK